MGSGVTLPSHVCVIFAASIKRKLQGNQWFSVFYFFYPLEFFVTSFALLLVLDRLTNFILPPQPVLFQQRLKARPLHHMSFYVPTHCGRRSFSELL
jgi:hypothetical protein